MVKLTGNVLLLLVVDPLAPLPLGLDTTELVGLTAAGVVVVVLLTTGSLRLDLPLPCLRPLLVVADVMLRPPEEREGELEREGRGDSASVGQREGEG